MYMTPKYASAIQGHIFMCQMSIRWCYECKKWYVWDNLRSI